LTSRPGTTITRLAKESETELLYRDMQTDIAQQTLRRLAAVKSL
jgi:LPS-assembly lipoprotein